MFRLWNVQNVRNKRRQLLLIYIMRKVVDYFVANGSTVNLRSLDITKAFDKVNHFPLFFLN